jgi:hypothetical protein
MQKLTRPGGDKLVSSSHNNPTGSWLDHAFQDIRYGARMLRKNPGLTLVMVLSLGIGIGANTAVFSVTNALLLKPLRYPDPGRLAILWLRSPGIGIDRPDVSVTLRVMGWH